MFQIVTPCQQAQRTVPDTADNEERVSCRLVMAPEKLILKPLLLVLRQARLPLYSVCVREILEDFVQFWILRVLNGLELGCTTEMFVTLILYQVSIQTLACSNTHSKLEGKFPGIFMSSSQTVQIK